MSELFCKFYRMITFIIKIMSVPFVIVRLFSVCAVLFVVIIYNQFYIIITTTLF